METVTILHRLGITSRYCGYGAVVMAVELVAQDEERLSALMKEVFIPIASRQGVAWKTVERNVRTIIRRAWAHSPEYLNELAGEKLEEPPSAGEFIRMVYQATKRPLKL